jgi:hypothetical protein
MIMVEPMDDGHEQYYDGAIIYREEVLRFEKEHGINRDSQNIPCSGVQAKENPKTVSSLLKMVIAMAMDGYGYNPEDKKSPVTKEIVEATQRYGVSIDSDTVKKHLKAGAELLSRNIEEKT